MADAESKYKTGQPSFNEALEVFAFSNKVGILEMIKSEKVNFSFLTDSDFKKVAQIIDEHTTINDLQISKKQGYWEENRRDYPQFILNAIIEVITPFLEGSMS